MWDVVPDDMGLDQCWQSAKRSGSVFRKQSVGSVIFKKSSEAKRLGKVYYIYIKKIIYIYIYIIIYIAFIFKKICRKTN
jgi:hypothetical protein